MKLTLVTGRHFHSFQSKFLPYRLFGRHHRFEWKV